MLLLTKSKGHKSNSPYSEFPNYLQTKSFLNQTKICAIFLIVWAIKPWGRFCKLLWPSQKSWTLIRYIRKAWANRHNLNGPKFKLRPDRPKYLGCISANPSLRLMSLKDYFNLKFTMWSSLCTFVWG